MTPAALALAGLLALTPTGSATTPPVDLVAGRATTARLDVPYPGHATAFDLAARAPAGAGPSDLTLVLDGGDGPLADGPDALQLTLTDTDGVVLAAGTAAELRGRAVPLGRLDAEPVTLHGTAALPASAGDAVQGMGLTLTLRLVAEQDAPTASGVLATTGARVLASAGAALALLLTGLLLVASRRRSRPEEDS